MRNKKTAFSVAEAMMALLIGSVALGAAAPMITKQIKHNNYSKVQTNIISQQLDRVTTQNNTRLEDMETNIEEIIENVENRLTNAIPSGAVMYFDLTACPSGWTPLVNKYPNASNAFIRNQSGSGRALGNYQTSAVPNVTGSFYALDQVNSYTGAFYRNGSITAGNYGKQGTYSYRNQVMDLSRVSSVYQDNVTEARPNNITLLACRKN